MQDLRVNSPIAAGAQGGQSEGTGIPDAGETYGSESAATSTGTSASSTLGGVSAEDQAKAKEAMGLQAGNSSLKKMKESSEEEKQANAEQEEEDEAQAERDDQQAVDKIYMERKQAEQRAAELARDQQRTGKS